MFELLLLIPISFTKATNAKFTFAVDDATFTSNEDIISEPKQLFLHVQKIERAACPRCCQKSSLQGQFMSYDNLIMLKLITAAGLEAGRSKCCKLLFLTFHLNAFKEKTRGQVVDESKYFIYV